MAQINEETMSDKTLIKNNLWHNNYYAVFSDGVFEDIDDIPPCDSSFDDETWVFVKPKRKKRKKRPNYNTSTKLHLPCNEVSCYDRGRPIFSLCKRFPRSDCSYERSCSCDSPSTLGEEQLVPSKDYFTSVVNQFPNTLFYLHISRNRLKIRYLNNDKFKYECIGSEVFSATYSNGFDVVHDVNYVMNNMIKYDLSRTNYVTSYMGYVVVVGYKDIRKYKASKFYVSHAGEDSADIVTDIRALLSGAISGCVDCKFTDDMIATVARIISGAHLIYKSWGTPLFLDCLRHLVLEVVASKDVRKYLDSTLSKIPLESQAAGDIAQEASMMLRNPLLDHLDTIVATMVLCGFVESDKLTVHGVSLFTTSFPKHTSARDIGTKVLDAISFLSNVAYECFTTRSFEPIRDTKSDLASFARNVSDIENQLPSVLHGNYDSIFLKDVTFFEELLTNTVAQSEKINRLYIASPPTTLAYIRVLCAKLHNCHDTYRVDQLTRGSRIRPLCLKFYGDTARGKSYINQHAILEVLKYNNYPSEPKNIVVVTDEKFDSTIKSNSTGVIMDDVANTVPERDEFNVAAKLIRFINNVCAPAVKAEAQDKGKVLLMPKVVGITTNCRMLASHYWSICPASILRRCDVHIDVYLRPEFMDSAGLLDSTKVNSTFSSTEIHDIYILRVMYFDIVSNELQCFIYNDDGSYPEMHMKPMSGISLPFFYHWLYTFSSTFFADQVKLQKTMQDMYESPRCEKCKRHNNTCVCNGVKNKYPISNFIPEFGISGAQAISEQRADLAHRNEVNISSNCGTCNSSSSDDTSSFSEQTSDSLPTYHTDMESRYYDDYFPNFEVDQMTNLQRLAYLADRMHDLETQVLNNPERLSTINSVQDDDTITTQFTEANSEVSLVSSTPSSLPDNPTLSQVWLQETQSPKQSRMLDDVWVEDLESQAFTSTVHGMLFGSLCSSVQKSAENAMKQTYFHLQADPFDLALRRVSNIDLMGYVRDYHDSPFAWNNWLPDEILHGFTNSWLGRKFALHSVDRSVYRTIRFWSLFYIVTSNALILSVFRRPSRLLLTANFGLCGAIVNYRAISTRKYLEGKLMIDRQLFESQCDRMTEEAIKEGKTRSDVLKWGLNVVSLGVVAYAITQAYKSFNKNLLSIEDQSALSPENETEYLVRNNESSVWKNGSSLSHYINSASSSTKTVAQFISTIQKNLRYIEFKQQGCSTICGCDAIFLRTDELMVPRHIFQSGVMVQGDDIDQIEYRLVRANKGGGEKPVPGSTMVHWKVAKISDTVKLGPDWVVLRTLGLSGDVRDLTKPDGNGKSLFVNEDSLNGRSLLSSVYRNSKGDLSVHEFACKKIADVCPTTAQMEDPKQQRMIMSQGREWKKGDCGTVVISRSSDPVIMGFHLYASSEKIVSEDARYGYAFVVTKEMIDNYLDSCDKQWLESHCLGNVPETINGVKTLLSQVTPRHSPINYVEGNYDVLGHTRGNDHYVTSLRTTKVHDFAQARCKKLYCPPDFRDSRPFDEFLKEASNPNSYLDHGLLRKCSDDYLSGLRPHFDKAKYIRKHIRPLSNLEIVNGIEGVRFIDRMKGSSAMGYPYVGKREKFLYEVSSEDGVIVRDWKDSTIWESFDKYHQDYRSGKVLSHPFKSSLKDEVRKSTKTTPRVFQAAPLFLQLFIRKYFLPLGAFLSTFPLSSECAVGINAFSVEWDEMMSHVGKYGRDRVFAGDYEKWDIKFEKELANSVYYVFLELARWFGYSEDDLIIMRAIKSDLMNPVLLLFGTVVRLAGINPSGQNMTAYVNSVGNSIKTRYMSYKITGYIFNFREQLSLMTYGDDMICGVSLGCKVNFVSYRDMMKSYNQNFTLPTKNTQLEYSPFLPWDECDFLKRRSVFIPELGYEVGALELDSIYKSLLYYSKSSCLIEEDIILSTIESASFEFAAHGRVIYDEGIIFLKECAAVYGMVGACPFLTVPFDLKINRIARSSSEPGSIGYPVVTEACFLE